MGYLCVRKGINILNLNKVFMNLIQENKPGTTESMKRDLFGRVFILLVTLAACQEPVVKAASNPAPKPSIDCGILADKGVVCSIANSILESGDNENIWNLSTLDTTKYFTVEDYFTNKAAKDRLVLIGGEAGLSAGSANNLMLLLSCTDSVRVLWSGQVGNIEKDGIRDLNGDGIREIICQLGMTWMGECSEYYHIFNFKKGQLQSLFQASSSSVLDCGLDSLGATYKQGDTIETTLACTLVPNRERRCQVQQIRTVKVHNGGVTNDEIKMNLTTAVDTVFIDLN